MYKMAVELFASSNVRPENWRAQRVCVIGAGAAGLAVARRFSEVTPGTAPGDSFDVTVYEQTAEVGGTWVYNHRTGCDSNGLPIHSSMYKTLVTNIPKEAMGYLDSPFIPGGRSFICHEQVLSYLRCYCEKFNLEPLIKFNTVVTRVEPIIRYCCRAGQSGHQGHPGWLVEIQDVVTKKTEIIKDFDAVAVCNGRYSIPHYPSLDGLDTFQGKVIHSHEYRMVDPFTDQVVACLGAGPSGTDLAMEMSACAKLVLLCHRDPPLVSPLPPNVQQMPWPIRCHPTALSFDAPDLPTLVPVDSLVICTGYDYSFSFLQGGAHLDITEGVVSPLYKHFLHPHCFPRLAIIGVPSGVIPFPLFHVQAHVFRLLMEGSLTLPASIDCCDPVAGMEAATCSEINQFVDGGHHRRNFHRLGPSRLAEYLLDLTTWAELPPVPPVIVECYRRAMELRKADLSTYRGTNFTLTETEVMERHLPDKDAQPSDEQGFV